MLPAPYKLTLRSQLVDWLLSSVGDNSSGKKEARSSEPNLGEKGEVANKMAQKVKVIAANPADLNSIPGWSHIVDREDWFPRFVSDPHTCAVLWHAHSPIHEHRGKTTKS